ncbi:extracellular solute-binding protein [Devosia rhodophyticola]|uniref:Extracellular solute-binding protein n=1 Tax=Devosia rhodophyticola TaxID=3026423 RepID=A0ABY7YUD7_9HYPH|nr:extracellular solute-binding protein [Devosia rhodophyticola]WDR04986.1 extracellular solute-binding protein [Devosia rhodophyticola]
MKITTFAATTGLVLSLLTGFVQTSLADDGQWHHANSAIGEPKYPEGFSHFDYVNVNAPKGGQVRLGAMGGFDTFNPILPKGEVEGNIGLIYETLMTPSQDEVLTDYGLLAEAMKYPDDYSSVTFRMDPAAKWHDGEPVTVDDVIWSYEKQKELNPLIAQYYANVTGVSQTAPSEVTFTFDQTGNRELPKILGQLMVLPRHWWEGSDAKGNKRDIGASTLEPPLGSGPYEIGSFEAGRTITYRRVKDYWGINHPTQVGQNNFDEYTVEYFRDLDVQFEAFKGDQFDWWLENRARRWATGYDFPAVKDGRVIQELFPEPYNALGLMVGFIPNLREPKFQDERVRKALNYAFDFEELNKTIFFGQYERINSYFYGLPFASSGLPEGKELEILNSVKDKIPASVYTVPYTNPVNGDPQKLRANLRIALNLLTEAGYKLDGRRLVDANGQQLSFEILLDGPTIEPVASNLVTNLAKIGINATLRTVDGPQYINRTRSFDYDMIYGAWTQSFSPGNEQRYFFGSGSAEQQGSRNYAGIADPGIDALIDKLIFSKDRETLEAATKALDRVLLAHDYVIPAYTLRKARSARWNRFSHPDKLPEFGIGFPSLWWYDEAKAKVTDAG